MVVCSKFKFKRLFSFFAVFLIFSLLLRGGIAVFNTETVFDTLFLKYKSDLLPSFLYPAAGLYIPAVKEDEKTESEPQSSFPSSSLSSEPTSSVPSEEGRLYFKSKTANLFPTETDGLSYYGRIFVNEKGVDVKKLFAKQLEVKSKTVIIVCSHFTEGYSESIDRYYPDSQSTADVTKNVFGVALSLAAALKQLGVRVIIDDTAFDSPHQNGAFERSGEALRELVSKNPDAALIIDLHRDTLKEENLTGIRTAASYGGTPVAQLSLSVPENSSEDYYEASKIFALKLQQMLESECPTVTRPITFLSGNYGYDGDILRVILTVGSQSNTVSEAKDAAKIAAKAIFAVISQKGN